MMVRDTELKIVQIHLFQQSRNLCILLSYVLTDIIMNDFISIPHVNYYRSDHQVPVLDDKDRIEFTMILTQDVREVEHVFRFMVFNIRVHNHNNHSKIFHF